MNPPKNPGISAVLAFLWPGAGYIYCGRFGLMIGAWAGYVVLLVVMSVGAGLLAGQFRSQEANGLILVFGGVLLVARICEIIHAYKIAEADNRRGPCSEVEAGARKGAAASLTGSAARVAPEGAAEVDLDPCTS